MPCSGYQTVDDKQTDSLQRDELTGEYVLPTRILWQAGTVTNTEHNGQADLTNASISVFKNERLGQQSSILLDFGTELHGGLEIVTGMWSLDNTPPRNIRVRFGESASESMAEIGAKEATNDQAIRDFCI